VRQIGYIQQDWESREKRKYVYTVHMCFCKHQKEMICTTGRGDIQQGKVMCSKEKVHAYKHGITIHKYIQEVVQLDRANMGKEFLMVFKFSVNVSQ
jgi:hypothetical protein